jgi:flagellar biosynthesis/type III secretory pathway protein FliH
LAVVRPWRTSSSAVEDLRREWRRTDEQRIGEWRRAAVELALAVATRLLHERITDGEFAVEALVRDMLGQFAGPPPVTVRLNPADLALLATRLDGRPLVPEGTPGPTLAADPGLGRGSCRLEAGGQMLLSDLADQLEEVRTHLLRSLGHVGS